MNTIAPTTAKAYFLTDGTIRDNYKDTLFHPLSTVNNIEIYVEDGDSDNVMTINYNPAVRKKWATHWFPCFYRGMVEHTLEGESEPRTFAQYLTKMPIILSSMNQNSETAMGVVATLRQQAGTNLIGSYATVGTLPTSYGDWLDLQDMEENDVVAYVYENGVNGFYMVEYVVDTYVWTLQTTGITNYVTAKQYDTWDLSIQAGFGNPDEITEISDEQYRLIWEELSNLSGYYTSNYDLIQDLIDGTIPAGKAVADQNGNVINTTYQLLSNLVTAFQVTPDDSHYASEKLLYDTIQNILNGTTPFTAMTLYNVNGNAVFTIDDNGVVRASYSGVNHELGENLFVRGDEVGTILNGDTVMFDGSIGASGKMNVVAITSANIALLIANPHHFLGIATQDFSGIQNRLNWYGGVSDLDTTSYPSNATYPAGEGKELYVDMVNGGLTYIRPDKPLPVIIVGAVVTYHATQGRVLVRPKCSVGLGNLHNVDLNGGVSHGDIIKYNSATLTFEIFNLDQALNLKEDISNKGEANGYAPLNELSLVPSEHLPSYIDSIVEVATYADLPLIGAANKIYVVIADETSDGNTSTYRWATTVYVMISNTMSAAEVKALYESNADTNEFNDAEKTKLANVPLDTNAELLAKMSKSEFASNGETGVVDEAILARTSQQLKSPAIPYGEIKMPNDFSPTLPFNIWRDWDNVVKHDFDIAQYEENLEETYYVKRSTGLDTNDGLTEITPLKTIQAALDKIGSNTNKNYMIVALETMQLYASEFYNSGGFYLRTGTRVYITTKDKDDRIISTSGVDGLSWSVNATYTNVYETTHSTTLEKFADLRTSNKDFMELPKPYTRVTTIAEVDVLPGSFFNDGSTMYVRTLDSIIPDNNELFACEGANFTRFVMDDGANFIFENIDIFTGNLFTASVGPLFSNSFTLNNCKVALSIGDGITGNNMANVYAFNCVVGYVKKDGFNYTFSSTPTGVTRRDRLAFEYNCIAYQCGHEATTEINNASTAHNGVSILRIGCIGYETKGPIIVDVNGCYSINVDCRARDSLVATEHAFEFDLTDSGAGDGIARLINCSGGGEVLYDLLTNGETYLTAFKGNRISGLSNIVWED